MLVRGRMRKGESLLVHAGTGGVGQAAISIALHMGCRVFTTVGSKEKREFLKKTFPQVIEILFLLYNGIEWKLSLLHNTIVI